MRQQHILFFTIFILIFSHFGVLSSVADVFFFFLISRKLKMKFTTKQGVEKENTEREKNLNKWDH